jgi:hypothetical protein
VLLLPWLLRLLASNPHCYLPLFPNPAVMLLLLLLPLTGVPCSRSVSTHRTTPTATGLPDPGVVAAAAAATHRSALQPLRLCQQPCPVLLASPIQP